MKNLKISLKLFLGFGILVFFLIGISTYAVLQIHQLYETSEGDAGRLQTLTEIQHTASKGFLYWEQSIEGRANRSTQEASEQWTLAKQGSEILINGGKYNGLSFQFEKDGSLRSLYQQMYDTFEDLLVKTRDLRGDSPEIRAVYERSLQQAEAAKQSIRSKSNVNNTRNTYEDIQQTLIIASIIIALFAIVMSIMTSRSIAVPVRNAAFIIRKDGLQTKLGIKRTDEIGQFAAAVDSFLASFREVVREVVDASSAVSSSSRNISISAESMAQGAQDQLGQSASVTASVEQMSKTNYEIARHLGSAKEMAIDAQGRADNSSEVMDQTIDSLHKMTAMVQQSSDVINTLSLASQKISKVVSIIEDITTQVNLIALNASIEASRAGEKGRGFAVVADEIKKLAERTAHSTTEIVDIVGKIQSNVSGATTIMQKGREEAQVTIRFAQQTKTTLNEISDAFKNVTMMVTQVAVSAQEQSSAGDQITENVKSINGATQQIANGITQIAKSAEYLNQLTANLQKMMRRFKLNAQ